MGVKISQVGESTRTFKIYLAVDDAGDYRAAADFESAVEDIGDNRAVFPLEVEIPESMLPQPRDTDEESLPVFKIRIGETA